MNCMKALILFSVFLFTPLAAYSEVWTPAAKAEDGTIISYDSASVKRFGDVVVYWEMSNYSKNAGQVNQIKSKKTQIEVNCRTGLDRATKIFAYSKLDARGDIVDAYIYDKANWGPALDGTAGWVMKNTICSLKV